MLCCYVVIPVLCPSLQHVQHSQIRSWGRCPLALVAAVRAFRLFLLPFVPRYLVSEKNGLAKLGSCFSRKICRGDQ